MKALTLWQPWAWAMTMPAWGLRKDVENRPWPCPANMLRQRFAIHAGKTWDDDGAHRIHESGLRFPNEAAITKGAIVAFATIDRCVTSSAELPLEQRRWFSGPYGFVFRDLAVLRKPIPCRGFQMFWTIPDDVLAEAIGQLVIDAEEHASNAGYTDPYRELLLRAVRRTARRGRDLDDLAWEATGLGSRAENAKAWLAQVGGAP